MSNLIEINERIEAFNAKRQAELKQAKAPAKAKEPVNEKGYKAGDYIYISWGWEQTNIDFYKIVKVTAKSISVLKVESEYNPIANMVDNVTPTDELARFDVFNPKHKEGKPLRVMTNAAYPSIKGHMIKKWNGQELVATSYA